MLIVVFASLSCVVYCDDACCNVVMYRLSLFVVHRCCYQEAIVMLLLMILSSLVVTGCRIRQFKSHMLHYLTI